MARGGEGLGAAGAQWMALTRQQPQHTGKYRRWPGQEPGPSLARGVEQEGYAFDVVDGARLWRVGAHMAHALCPVPTRGGWPGSGEFLDVAWWSVGGAGTQFLATHNFLRHTISCGTRFLATISCTGAGIHTIRSCDTDRHADGMCRLQ
eukprot:2952082-Prymnesium_polylepis.1